MKVQYKRMVEGIETLGIIYNGHYFLTRLPVFEDGSFDCWRRVDLDGLAAEIERGWLSCAVPVGEMLSIFQLASLTVLESRFAFTPEGYYQYLQSLVKAQNYDLVGLYRETAEQKARWSAQRVGWRTHHKPYKVTSKVGYKITDGDGKFVFYREAKGWTVAVIAAYADGTLAISAKEERYFTLEEIQELFDQGILSAELPDGTWLRLGALGSVRGEFVSQTGNQEKLAEITEMFKSVCGQETAHDLCLRWYHAYLVDPCDFTRDKLREAYEAVPEQERCYLGDMDTRDTDIVRILYYPEEKRSV